MNLKEILSVSLILFSVIDILGSLPAIISMKKQGKKIESLKATLISGLLMLAFLFGGESILNLFGVDVQSFAVAGAIILFLLGLEMVLGVSIFKDNSEVESSTVVPLAFPLIAGAGTLTTILALRSEFNTLNIGIGITLNLVFVYIVLRSSSWIHRKMGKSGEEVLRKVFGIVLLAIAIKLFKTNLLVGFSIN